MNQEIYVYVIDISYKFFLAKAKDLGNGWFVWVILFREDYKCLEVVLGYFPDISVLP